MRTFVILSGGYRDELVAVVDAESQSDALEKVRSYVTAADEEPATEHRAEPLESWRYDAARNTLPRYCRFQAGG